MKEYLVTEVKNIVTSPVGFHTKLTMWINDMADQGWSVEHVDNGVLYLSRKKEA